MAVTMTFRWDDAGTLIPVGQAKYAVNEQPVAEYDNWAMYTLAADMQDVIDDVINKFNANSILKADTDNTPAALAIAEQTIVGRKTGSSIAALTAAEVRTILNVESGADVTDTTNVNAAGAVMNSDFDAHTILRANIDNIPGPLSVGTNTFVGRTSGNIAAMNGAAARSVLNVEDGAEANLFEEITNVLREKLGGGYDNDFVIGSPQLADDGNTAHDYRMWFDKSKGAFRAGAVTDSKWDSGNVGNNSFAVGYGTTASNIQTCALGYGTIASGERAYAEGDLTVASGDGSHAEGYRTTSSGIRSHAEGDYAEAYLRGQYAKAASHFSATGDAQYSNVVLMTETTSATQTELTIAGGTPTAANRVILPANRTWAFTISIAARQTAGIGTIGDSGIYKIEGGIKRDGANNTALVGTITKTVLAEDQSAWDVTAEADDTNECLVVKVTGEASKTLHWVAKIDLVEVG